MKIYALIVALIFPCLCFGQIQDSSLATVSYLSSSNPLGCGDSLSFAALTLGRSDLIVVGEVTSTENVEIDNWPYMNIVLNIEKEIYGTFGKGTIEFLSWNTLFTMGDKVALSTSSEYPWLVKNDRVIVVLRREENRRDDLYVPIFTGFLRQGDLNDNTIIYSEKSSSHNWQRSQMMYERDSSYNLYMDLSIDRQEFCTLGGVIESIFDAEHEDHLRRINNE